MDNDQDVVSNYTWSQYTSVDSPRMPGSSIDSAQIPTLPSSNERSDRARGHGEPPEDISSGYPSEAILSDYLSDSFQPASDEEVSGRLNGINGGASEGAPELGWSPQGCQASPFSGYQAPMGAPFASPGSPQQSVDQPSHNTDDDREDEEQLAPGQTTGIITGNGPVPLNRGNIGESLGTERNPPNGI